MPGAPFCTGQQATLCAPVDPAYTYTWSLNGSLYTGAPNANAQCINPFPIAGDTFVVNVGQPSGCGFKLVYVPTPITISTAYSFTYHCMTATFTDGTPAVAGPITNWAWTFGDGSTSTLQNPTHTYSTAGTFTATLTVTNSSGCTATVNHIITVIGPPLAVFSNTLPCLGTATSFSNGSISPIGDPINTYLWNFGDGTPTSNLVSPSHTYANAGTYTVTLTVTTVGGCIDTVTQTIVVYGNPVANFSAPDSGCSPVCQTFTDLSLPVDGNIVTWQWAFNGGTPAISTIQNPTSCWTAPGSYSVSLTVTTNYGCKNSITLPMIQVFNWPSANFCFAPSIAPYTNPNFIFCDLWSSDVTNWYWNFGDGSPLDSINTDPAHSYSATITNNDFYQYTVTLYVKNVHGCWDTITKVVEIVPEYTFYIPNTFTPNNDFINETFFGKGRGIKEYNIWLFDRWGNLIWNCNRTDKNVNWDSNGQDGLPSACKWSGKVTNAGVDMNSTSNQLVQEDVYVWKVRLVDVFDKRHLYIGHVNVVR
jgi:PKD repeat protein